MRVTRILSLLLVRVLTFLPISPVPLGTRLIRLGSKRGGWYLLESRNLIHAVALLAGCGEDISFDIELTGLYLTKTLLVDPTPRAYQHFSSVIAECATSRCRSLPYRDLGPQPVSAYPTHIVRAEHIKYLPFALTDNAGDVVDFFPPLKSSDVSYSIFPWQNSQNSSHSNNILSVETIDIQAVLLQTSSPQPYLVKLDIEGAESIVVPNMLNQGFRPAQILLEFDLLFKPNVTSILLFWKVVACLLRFGYRLVKRDGYNYTFFHPDHL